MSTALQEMRERMRAKKAAETPSTQVAQAAQSAQDTPQADSGRVPVVSEHATEQGVSPLPQASVADAPESAEVATPQPPPNSVPAEAKEFQEMLHELPGLLESTEELKHVLQQLMITMHEHPGFVEMLAPDDVGIFVHAVRQATGHQADEKRTRSNKRKSSVNKEFSNQLESQLGDLL